MSTSAVESKSCECVCQVLESGEKVCICEPACGAGKTVEWTCRCDFGLGKLCQCKFTLSCSRKEGEGSCPAEGCERDVFECKCICADGEGIFRIRKCPCCQVIATECGSAEGKGQCGDGSCAKGKCC